MSLVQWSGLARVGLALGIVGVIWLALWGLVWA
jgi:hypothetical protein